jgi:hypothetical protein
MSDDRPSSARSSLDRPHAEGSEAERVRDLPQLRGDDQIERGDARITLDEGGTIKSIFISSSSPPALHDANSSSHR